MMNISYASVHVMEKPKRHDAWKKLLQTMRQDVWLQEQVVTCVLTANNDLADVVR